MPTSVVPSFYLYGEPHRTVAEGFVHVEPLDHRSRPSEWTIRPHAHAELVQIFLVEGGGGSMLAEDRAFTFVAPCLLLLPAGVVHGFEWRAESHGQVVTAAQAFAAEIARIDAALSRLFTGPAVVPLTPEGTSRAIDDVKAVRRELGWAAPGHRAAVSAALLSVMVTALRSAEAPAPDAEPPGRRAQVVARFRERVEDRFRLRESIHSHAVAIGVSLTALRVACARVAGASPAMLLDQRALLEAKRALLYTRLSVAEVAWSVGFSDAAYFSRFFARRVGVSPRSYRETRRGVMG
jgi:AraC family transcriptional activator of pobA